MRRLLPLALLALACQKGIPGPTAVGDGGRLVVTCAADRPVARVGEAVAIQCSPALPAASWRASPALGALDGSGARATFVLPAAAVDRAFGDTTFTLSAIFGSGAEAVTAAASVVVLGDTWLARSDAAALEAYASDGTPLGLAATSLDGPALALAPRSDGALLAAQSPTGGAPPVVVLSRSGGRVSAFDAVDASGGALFSEAHPPRALRQMRDGTVWVTGGPRPVVYAATGRFVSYAAAAPDVTLGIAQLPDGRVAATYQWANGIALYDEAGATVEKHAVASALPYGESYGALGALALDPQGRLVVAAAHFDAGGWSGSLLRLGLSPSPAVEAELPPASRVAYNVPWALSLEGGELHSAPSPAVATTRAACPYRFDAGLAGSAGCLVPGTSYRGVVHLGPAPAGGGP